MREIRQRRDRSEILEIKEKLERNSRERENIINYRERKRLEAKASFHIFNIIRNVSLHVVS